MKKLILIAAFVPTLALAEDVGQMYERARNDAARREALEAEANARNSESRYLEQARIDSINQAQRARQYEIQNPYAPPPQPRSFEALSNLNNPYQRR